MEPIRTTKTARLGRLKMYREELDQFLGLFQNCATVTISDSRNRYKSLDEMKTHVGPMLKELDIRGENPTVHFLLNQKKHDEGSDTPAVFNELRTEEISDEAEVTFLRIKEFLTEHERPSYRVAGLMMLTLAFISVFWILIHNLTVVVAHGQRVTARAQYGFLFCLFALVPSMLAAFYFKNYLSLETRVNSPSFWARHRDAFAAHAVTSAISGIVGLIIGGIGGYLLGHFLK